MEEVAEIVLIEQDYTIYLCLLFSRFFFTWGQFVDNWSKLIPYRIQLATWKCEYKIALAHKIFFNRYLFIISVYLAGFYSFIWTKRQYHKHPKSYNDMFYTKIFYWVSEHRYFDFLKTSKYWDQVYWHDQVFWETYFRVYLKYFAYNIIDQPINLLFCLFFIKNWLVRFFIFYLCTKFYQHIVGSYEYNNVNPKLSEPYYNYRFEIRYLFLHAYFFFPWIVFLWLWYFPVKCIFFKWLATVIWEGLIDFMHECYYLICQSCDFYSILISNFIGVA